MQIRQWAISGRPRGVVKCDFLLRLGATSIGIGEILYRLGKFNIVLCIGQRHQLALADSNQSKIRTLVCM